MVNGEEEARLTIITRPGGVLERAVEEQEIPEGVRVIRRGGVGDVIPTTEEAEAQRKAAQEREIEQRREAIIAESKRSFQTDLRTLQNVQERAQRVTQLAREIKTAQDVARQEKLQEGIIERARLSTGEIVTREQVQRVTTAAAERQIETPRPVTQPVLDLSTRITERIPEDFEPVQDPNVLRRIKTKVIEVVKGLGQIPIANQIALTEVFTEAERQLAEQGRTVPIDPSIIRKETIIAGAPEFLTDEELEGLSFGGLDQLVKRKQAELNFQARQTLDAAQNQVNPQFQGNVKAIIDEFQEGRLSKAEAEVQLRNLEEDYKRQVLAIAEPQIDIQTTEVQSFIDAVAKQQRKVRALTLAPVAFAEGFIIGGAVRGAVRGVGAAATVLGFGAGAQQVAATAVSVGAVGLLAAQTPQIVRGLRDDPIAFLLETVPFAAGAFFGSNPQVVTRLRGLSQRFVQSQKQLLRDTRARTGARTKQQQKQKQEQVLKSRKKLNIDRKKLKEILKEATNEDIKRLVEEAKQTLDLEGQRQLVATILEAKTGTSILTESGEILFENFQQALSKFTRQQRVQVTQITQQEGVTAISPLLQPITPQVIEPQVQPQVQPTNVLDISSSILGGAAAEQVAEAQVQPQVSLSSLLFGQAQVSAQAQQLLQRQAAALAQTQGLTQAQALAQLQAQAFIQPQLELFGGAQQALTGQPVTPVTITPIIPTTAQVEEAVMVIAKKKRKEKEAWDVLVRRKGEFFLFAKDLPRKRALKKGSDFVEKSLARTFKLRPSGTTTKKDISFNMDNRVFRAPKNREKNVFIERKQFALDSRTEVLGIQKARRQSAKKPKRKKRR